MPATDLLCSQLREFCISEWDFVRNLIQDAVMCACAAHLTLYHHLTHLCASLLSSAFPTGSPAAILSTSYMYTQLFCLLSVFFTSYAQILYCIFFLLLYYCAILFLISYFPLSFKLYSFYTPLETLATMRVRTELQAACDKDAKSNQI